MKCTKCNAKLNPYLLRQADLLVGELVFEVVCPECTQINTLTPVGYFSLKRDWIMPKVNPVNNKMPSEMRVIFVSMERCGISWIVRNLNRIHEYMFGNSINFTPEISPVIATRERFPLPEKWNNVYNVDPELLIKRGYDKVIIVYRDLETLLKVYQLYYPTDLAPEQREKFQKKSKEDFKIVYGKRIHNDKCFWLPMDDLNNYTEDTFLKLMDFLNFPEEGRPILFVVKPPDLRNWEVFSSILQQGQDVSPTLQRISREYSLRDGLLEYTADIRNQDSVKNVSLNNILVIGPNIHKGCHISENMYTELERMGYNVHFLPVENLSYGTGLNIYFKEYKERKKLYPLSKTIKQIGEDIDLIFIDEPHILFHNDVRIPVFYAHREFKRPPKVFYPDVAFFWHRRVATYFSTMFAPHWANHVPQKAVMPPAFNPSQFKQNVKKTIKGISNMAGREKLSEVYDIQELTATSLVKDSMAQSLEVNNYIPYIQNEEGRLTDEEFRETLPKCEAIWVLQPVSQYISRRMLEAMYCKCVVFLKLENQEHDEILRDMGFIPMVHYVNIEKLEDLKGYNEVFEYNDYKEMIEKAYDVVINHHTYKARAKFIIDFYRDWAIQKRGVVVE